MDCLDHETGLIIVTQDSIECSIVLLVLLGIHWYQAPAHDCLVSSGKHAAFVHEHCVYAKINVMVLGD